MDEATAKGKLTAFIEKAKKDNYHGIDEFNTKRSHRKAVRIQITKHINHLNTAIADANPCIHEIGVSLEKVTKAFNDMTDLDEYILAFIIHYDEDVAAADEFLADHWYRNANKATASARKAIADLTPPAPLAATVAPTAAPAAASANFSEVKLPKVELPTFAGNSSSDYHSFITQFNSSVHIKPIPNHQKLLYLKSCCILEAEEIAKPYSVTDDNYDQLYGVLKRRFGKPRMIKQS